MASDVVNVLPAYAINTTSNGLFNVTQRPRRRCQARGLFTNTTQMNAVTTASRRSLSPRAAQHVVWPGAECHMHHHTLNTGRIASQVVAALLRGHRWWCAWS